ncbi:MAG TPA: SH3 domain-containing protein [Chloroflexota bacterium]
MPAFRAVAWLAVVLALSLGSAEAAEVEVGREATVKSVAGLNLRSEPSPDAPVLTVAEGGDFVNVLGVSGDWYRVEYDGTVGWVSGVYLGPARDRGTLSARGSRRGGDAVVTDSGVLLRVPYRTQLDGSAYAGANCGPASVGMALEAFGTYMPTTDIRRAANRMQGTTGWYDVGTSLDVLAEIAARNGLVVRGLHSGGGYDRWSFDDVRRALRNGHVVIPQVHLATLPGQEHSSRAVDHFIVIVGYKEGRFIYHDPAFVGGGGHSLQIGEERLSLAWKRSDYPFAAFSVGPGAGMEPLIAPPPAPAPPETSEPAAPAVPPRVVVPADHEGASAALRRLLEAEAATHNSPPRPELPLADPVAADVYEPAREVAATAATPTPVAAPPTTTAPGSRFEATRAWPLVLAAALGLALLGSRRIAGTGRVAGQGALPLHGP